MEYIKQQLKLSRRCLNRKERSDLIDVLKEDMMRDQSAIDNIVKNRELVTELAIKTPEELIKIYNYHLIRSQRLLQTIENIPTCQIHVPHIPHKR